MKSVLEDFELKARVIHGFSNKTRLQILETIRDGEKTVTQIVETVEGNQSNVSQHLACLRGCGLIIKRVQGKYVYYSLRNETVRELLQLFEKLTIEVGNEPACCEHHMGEV
ncbi:MULTISPECIES: metalloregulator ArsR/SmtB family transcription factor [unclassified Exiguobacterium]|uniref:ArsR/SmtB family transcription factor n=1 Tax=unclassified Exiguobacterium TaxID=2644629 RepID=UPI001BEBB472|nr:MULTISPECIES: metalloregulator ArsR/SmtB family transcription factor [unclassified Exiguobacterium]